MDWRLVRLVGRHLRGYSDCGGESTNATGFSSGTAYLFQRDEGGVNNWGEVTKITASDGAAYHGFGRSVAIPAGGGTR